MHQQSWEQLRVVATALKDRFRDEGMESVDLSPEQLTEFLAREVTQSQKLVTDLKIEKY